MSPSKSRSSTPNSIIDDDEADLLAAEKAAADAQRVAQEKLARLKEKKEQERERKRLEEEARKRREREEEVERQRKAAEEAEKKAAEEARKKKKETQSKSGKKPVSIFLFLRCCILNSPLFRLKALSSSATIRRVKLDLRQREEQRCVADYHSAGHTLTLSSLGVGRGE